MKETVFNSLPVVTSQSAIDALTIGDYFLYDNPDAVRGGRTEMSKQQNNTALRHRIVYCQRITAEEYPQGITRNFRYVYDILESDILTQESKTATRRGKNRAATRDDDDGRDILTDPDWA